MDGRRAGPAHGSRIAVALLSLAAACAAWRLHTSPRALADFAMPTRVASDARGVAGAGAAPRGDGVLERGFLPNETLADAHAASLVELPDARVLAFWLHGNEGSPDAVIASASFDAARAQWSAPRIAADPRGTGIDERRWVRKVGNAVAHADADGTLRLFYVTVAAGGWAASAVNLRESRDGGHSWGPARRLVASPFLNLSTLVRHAPVPRSDGTLALPMYHELATMYGELARIDRDGRLSDLKRLNDRYVTVQPQLLVEGPRAATALMRNAGEIPRHVVHVRTGDAGEHWSGARETALANPGSPVAGLVLDAGERLLVLNEAQENRRSLSLAWSGDAGAHWRTIHRFEDEEARAATRRSPDAFEALVREIAADAGVAATEVARVAHAVRVAKCDGPRCDVEYSYPSLLRTRDARFLLVYTWNRVFVRWVRFDAAWLAQRIADARRADR